MRGVLPQNNLKMDRNMFFSVTLNGRIISKRWDTWKMSMNHDDDSDLALSDFVNKNGVKRALAEDAPWRHIPFIRNPYYPTKHTK